MDARPNTEHVLTEQHHNPDLETDLKPGFEPLRTCFALATVLLGLLVNLL